MKILALVPDPRAAYGLGAVLAALPRPAVRAIAYGTATAAALPPGLDVAVYPVREGTRLPAPFLEALVRHEAPGCVLAPVGAVTTAAVPVLAVDLDPSIPAEACFPKDEDEGGVAWVEALTPDPNRRRALLAAGLFSVDLNPSLFDLPGRLAAHAAPTIHARLVDMAAIEPRPRPERPSDAKAVEPFERPPAAPAHAAPSASLEAAPAPVVTSPAPAAAAAPASTVRIVKVTSGPRASASQSAAPEPKAAPHAAPRPVVVPLPPVAAQDASVFRYRCRGGRVLVVAGIAGVDALTPADLAHATVVAVPDAISWLQERMAVAQFVCAASPPVVAAAAPLAASRTVLVHADHVDGASAAPRARARVIVPDLHRAGGPALGWSDDMTTGFFPGPGDVGLALQWTAWLDPAEIVVAGLDPREARPHWPAFARGARELLTGRGINLVLYAPVGPPIGLHLPPQFGRPPQSR